MVKLTMNRAKNPEKSGKKPEKKRENPGKTQP
jgi:hypothetical protein